MKKTTYNTQTSRTAFKGGGGPQGPTPAEIQKEKYMAALRSRQGMAKGGNNQAARTGRKAMTRSGYGVYIPRVEA